MPFSQSSQISAIMKFIEKVQPTSILDVGTGMGQYGFLSRMNLENVNLFEINTDVAKQRKKEEWKIKIDGIEGFSTYLTPVHDYCYNNIIIGEAFEVLQLQEDNSYDLILAIDILEHFDKEDGYKFLNELKRVCSKIVLVSTPKEFISQEVEANTYENHRSLWYKEELNNFDFTDTLLNDISWICIYEKIKS